MAKLPSGRPAEILELPVEATGLEHFAILFCCLEKWNASTGPVDKLCVGNCGREPETRPIFVETTDVFSFQACRSSKAIHRSCCTFSNELQVTSRKFCGLIWIIKSLGEP